MFEIDGVVRPWLMPRRFAPPELRATLEEACGANPEPEIIEIPNSLDGIALREFVSLEIGMDGKLASLPVFAGLDRFDQEYFPEMVEKIREENRSEFGEGSDRPD